MRKLRQAAAADNHCFTTEEKVCTAGITIHTLHYKEHHHHLPILFPQDLFLRMSHGLQLRASSLQVQVRIYSYIMGAGLYGLPVDPWPDHLLPCGLVSFPDLLSSACILKAIRAGVGWVWDRDYLWPYVFHVRRIATPPGEIS